MTAEKAFDRKDRKELPEARKEVFCALCEIFANFAVKDLRPTWKNNDGPGLELFAAKIAPGRGYKEVLCVLCVAFANFAVKDLRPTLKNNDGPD